LSPCDGSTNGGGGTTKPTTGTVTGKITTQFANDSQYPATQAGGQSQNVFVLFNPPSINDGVAEVTGDGSFSNPSSITGVPPGLYCVSGFVNGGAGIGFQYKLAKVPVVAGNNYFNIFLVRANNGDIQTTIKDKSGKTIISGNDTDHSACDNVNVLTDLAFPPEAKREYKKDCNIEQSHTGWLFCHVIKDMASSANGLDKYINSLLTIPTSQIFDKSTASGNAYYKAWSNMRNIALAILVIAAIVMVVAQALGLEILDAYTVRKIFPRILIAVIAITLSWSIMLFAVSLTNDVGGALRNIIYEPFKNITGGTFGLRGGGGALASLLVLPGIVALKFSGVTSLIASGLIALFVGFLVMILREIVVTMLIILAPVAIVFFILPNTQQVYKLWWESFSKALLMFPIIAALIASGRVLAVTTYALSKNAPGGLGPVYEVVSFVAYFVPYFILPFTLRFAGRFLGTIGSTAHSQSKGLSGMLKKGRQARTAKSLRELADGSYMKGNNRVANRINAVTAGAAAVPAAGFNPRMMRANVRQRAGASRLHHLEEFMHKNPAFAIFSGDDDVLESILDGDGSDNAIYGNLKSKGATDAHAKAMIAAIRTARREIPGGNTSLKMAAFMSNPATGTGWKVGGSGKMLQTLNNVSGGNVVVAEQLLHHAREQAKSGNRIDLFGTDMHDQMHELEHLAEQGNTNAAAAHATEVLNAKVLQATDPRAIMRARAEAVEMLSKNGGMTKNLNSAKANLAAAKALPGANKAAVDKAERDLSYELAKISGLYDMSASSTPENAEVLAKNVLIEQFEYQGSGMDKPQLMSIREMIALRAEDEKLSHDFLDMRREYSGFGEYAHLEGQAREIYEAAREANKPPGQ
jgi:hypothetical protein